MAHSRQEPFGSYCHAVRRTRDPEVSALQLHRWLGPEQVARRDGEGLQEGARHAPVPGGRAREGDHRGPTDQVH